MKQTTLNIEIIKTILQHIGVDGKYCDKGIYSEFNKINDTINIEYDGGKTLNHNLYSGLIKSNEVDNGNLKCLLLDLSTQESGSEFSFVWEWSGSIYGINLVFDDVGSALYKVYNNGKWTDVSMQIKCMQLSGFEALTDAGVLWDKNNNYLNLKKAIISLAE